MKLNIFIYLNIKIYTFAYLILNIISNCSSIILINNKQQNAICLSMLKWKRNNLIDEKILKIILNCVINETELFQVKISYDLFNFYS